MADGRILRKKISLNLELASLESDSERLLFTWMLAHADVRGRLPGDPRIVKGQIVPLLENFTVASVDRALAALNKVGLINRYSVAGKLYVEIPGFLRNQNLRADREAKSLIPDPEQDKNSGTTPGAIQESSCTTPEQRKGNSGELPTSHSHSYSHPYPDIYPYPQTDNATLQSAPLKVVSKNNSDDPKSSDQQQIETNLLKHPSGFKTLPSQNNQDDELPEPTDQLSTANPWAAFGLNRGIAGSYRDFDMAARKILFDLKEKNQDITNLEAADTLINECKWRKIEYPPGLLKRVKEMKRSQKAS